VPRILVNTRCLDAPVTGTQRYTRELLTRWADHVETIAPRRFARGSPGHAWEQLVLPSKLSDRFLFCPSNTAPLCVADQLVTIHDMSVFDYAEGFNPTFAAWYRFLLPKVAHRVKHIITVSNFVKDRILIHTGVCADKITVIPNGVSPSFSPEALGKFDGVASSLNLPSRQYILAVGSVEPRKNLNRLLDAWARILDRVPEELWLVIVGNEGSTRVFSQNKFGRLPRRVFFAGRVNESLLPSLYTGALLLAYVSLYEGFGLPVVEAMAAGTPVLTGNRSALPEVVGEAGLTVDPENEEEIAEGMRALVENSALREDLHRRGLIRAKMFSWDDTARRTWCVLQQVAGT